MKLMVVLTKDITAALDKKSAAMGLNRSAYYTCYAKKYPIWIQNLLTMFRLGYII